MTLVSVISGAGSGIGRAAAIALSARGHRLVLAGRRQDRLEETAQMLSTEAIAIACDVTDDVMVESVFKTANAHFGRVDVLFNNAGVFNASSTFDQLPLAEWRKMIDVNLTGYFICAQHAFRIMKAQSPRGGRIINNGSVSAHVPRPQSAPYAAAKHGVTGLTRVIALDGRAHDIACGQIDIGNAATALADGFEKGVLQPDGSYRPETTFDTDHAAEAVAYMASLPLNANVLFMTIMATQMPFAGRG